MTVPAAGPPVAASPAGTPRSRWWWALALPLVGFLLRTDYRQYEQVIRFREAFLTTVAVLVALLVLMAWMRRGPFWPRRMIESRAQLAAVLLLVLVGAAARLYRFDVYPPADGQLWEEAQMGAGGYSTLHEGGLDNFFPLTTLTAETGFRLLGVSLPRLRVPFVVLGIASVALFFVGARLFFQSFFAAWFATGLFATSALLAAAARIALETMSPVTTECIALGAVFYACTKRDGFAFALAGFANGLLLTEYFSYKIVPVFSGLLLLAYVLREPDAPYCNASGPWRGVGNLVRRLPLLALAAGFAIAVAVPVLLSEPGGALMPFIEGFARHKYGLSVQAARESLGQAVADGLQRMRLMATFVFIGGGGGDLLPLSLGAVELYTGVLGAIALLYCAVRAWRAPAKLFLAAAVVLTVALSGLLVQNPQRYRLMPVVPIWFLMTGVLVDDILAAVPRYRRALGALFVVVLAAVAGHNAYNLFVVALADRDVQLNFYDLNVVLAQEIAALQRQDPQATVYLLSRREHLAYVNDYYFLYDKNRVRVVSRVDQLAGAQGFLVADNEFVQPAVSFPRAVDCRRWRPGIQRDEIASCRLRPEG